MRLRHGRNWKVIKIFPISLEPKAQQYNQRPAHMIWFICPAINYKRNIFTVSHKSGNTIAVSF